MSPSRALPAKSPLGHRPAQWTARFRLPALGGRAHLPGYSAPAASRGCPGLGPIRRMLLLLRGLDLLLHLTRRLDRSRGSATRVAVPMRAQHHPPARHRALCLPEEKAPLQYQRQVPGANWATRHRPIRIGLWPLGFAPDQYPAWRQDWMNSRPQPVRGASLPVLPLFQVLSRSRQRRVLRTLYLRRFLARCRAATRVLRAHSRSRAASRSSSQAAFPARVPAPLRAALYLRPQLVRQRVSAGPSFRQTIHEAMLAVVPGRAALGQPPDPFLPGALRPRDRANLHRLCPVRLFLLAR